jgi:diguanylate cyclase (GGDEF)-like protein
VGEERVVEVPDSNESTQLQRTAEENLADPAISVAARRVLLLLDELNASRAGAIVYQQVERILKESDQDHAEREHVFRFWLSNLLDAYAQHLKQDTPLYVQTRLIQKQLKTPLALSELKSLRRYIDMYTMHSERLQSYDEKILQKAIQPLLAYYGGDGPLPEEPQAPQARQRVNDHETELQTEASMEDYELESQPEEEQPEELLAPNDQDMEQKIASTYRRYLNTQQQNAAKVQQMLAQRIQETIEENRQFGSMLDSVSNGLQEAENMQDIQVLRKCLLEDVSSLSQTHHALIDRLSETKSYLRMIETDSRKLSDELARVRMLSMTDELTELPNRRAFMRRLEDEVGRTKRYGFRLALVMLDLDNFKTINDRFGHAGGDSVLRTYANDILTVFRQHDMVARYGGEEFAVLLPNTDEHGAQAALNKVRRVVAETRCVHDDDIIETPTFSAGLTMYVNGDTPATLIQRADDALYTAKRLGRNRVEVKYGIALENKPVKFKPVVNKGNNS